MVFDWDDAKAAANLAKHGVPFEAVTEFEFTSALFLVDDRRLYGEVREWALGVIGNRLHLLVFTRRGPAMRVISLRAASRRERTQYNAWLDELEERDD